MKINKCKLNKHNFKASIDLLNWNWNTLSYLHTCICIHTYVYKLLTQMHFISLAISLITQSNITNGLSMENWLEMKLYQNVADEKAAAREKQKLRNQGKVSAYQMIMVACKWLIGSRQAGRQGCREANRLTLSMANSMCMANMLPSWKQKLK